MKKIFLQITSIILLLVSCSDDESNESLNNTTIDENRPLIQSIEYSEDEGNVFSTFLYDIEGKLEKKIDADGNLLYQNFYLNSEIQKKETYNIDGSISSIENFEYDSQNRLIKRIFLNDNNSITRETTYLRNDSDNTVEIFVNNGSSLIKHYLNSSNKVIKTEIYFRSNNEYILNTTTSITRDDNENVTKITSRSSESIFESYFSYDSQMNPFQLIDTNITLSSTDALLDPFLSLNPHIVFTPTNNYIKQETELMQLNGEDTSFEVSRIIEYNEDSYPVKISTIESNSTGSSIFNSVTIINYQ